MTDLLTLDCAEEQKKLKVVEIQGGQGIRQRLNHMGIHAGDKVIMKRSGIMGGPILIQIHRTEVAIGRGMARKIVVTECE